jgi:tetratricopeptide (TPR) repeat protein
MVRVPIAPTIRVLAAVVFFQTVIPSSLEAQHPPSPGELRRQALDRAYNLDYQSAADLLRKAIAASPSDPAPYRTLASVTWQRILYQRGAVTVDHYLGSLSRARVDVRKPPPELDAEFRRRIRSAIELSEAAVKRNHQDPQAHYDLGAALGLEASYMATVEGRMLAGFRAARRCYDEHERVLALDGHRSDAALAVGIYRYAVSTLSLPMRALAYVAGFGGGKERGIALVQRAAAGGGEARIDALFALVLIHNREGRFGEALDILKQLRRLYPGNRLIILEAGATALRAGDAARADGLLTEGLGILARETRPPFPGEEQLWRYKRGLARAALGRTNALDDLRTATAPEALAWVAGRAHVEIGRLALKRGDRASALTEARQGEALCQNGNDSQCVEHARDLRRSAHGR